MAMGNALTASANDYHATYYNPAQLMERPHVHVGTGFSYVHPALSIDRNMLGSEHPSVLPVPNSGFTIGVSTPLGGVFKNRVAFGFGLFMPMMQMTRAEAIDYNSPQFYRYQNLTDKLIILLGGAIRLTDWLDVGIGAQILADLDGRGDVSLSLVDQRVTKRRLSIDLHGDVALTAGVTVRPVPSWAIAVSYRSALDLSYKLPLTAEIEEVGTIFYEIQGTSLYTPHQLNAGVSYRLLDNNLLLTSDVTVAFWSAAPSASPKIKLLLEAKDTDPPENLLEAESGNIPLNAQTTVTTRLGVEYKPIESIALRAGYVYRPTPIPNQIYQTNYGDSDAHVASVGLAYSFHDPTKVHKKPLTIGLAAQMTFLRPRHVGKSDKSNETGSYDLDGAVWTLGFDIQHDF